MGRPDRRFAISGVGLPSGLLGTELDLGLSVVSAAWARHSRAHRPRSSGRRRRIVLAVPGALAGPWRPASSGQAATPFAGLHRAGRVFPTVVATCRSPRRGATKRKRRRTTTRLVRRRRGRGGGRRRERVRGRVRGRRRGRGRGRGGGRGTGDEEMPASHRRHRRRSRDFLFAWPRPQPVAKDEDIPRRQLRGVPPDARPAREPGTLLRTRTREIRPGPPEALRNSVDAESRGSRAAPRSRSTRCFWLPDAGPVSTRSNGHRPKLQAPNIRIIPTWPARARWDRSQREAGEGPPQGAHVERAQPRHGASDVPRQGLRGRSDGVRPDQDAPHAHRRHHRQRQERVHEHDHHVLALHQATRRAEALPGRPQDGRDEPVREDPAPHDSGGDGHGQGRRDPGMGGRKDGGAIRTSEGGRGPGHHLVQPSGTSSRDFEPATTPSGPRSPRRSRTWSS